MSRGEAKRRFTVEDHRRMTEGVECRKDADVIDETPAAYKSIDAVMAAQPDLADDSGILHRARTINRHAHRDLAINSSREVECGGISALPRV
jgi:RNA-splicing ligase RtcB